MQGIFLDLEATGLDWRQHHVLEIAFQIVDLQNGQLKQSYNRLIDQPPEVWQAADPTSLQVNGLAQRQHEAKYSASHVRDEILSTMRHCQVSRRNSVFICQNPSFDRAFFAQLIDPYAQESLLWPYHWLDLASMFWTHQIHHKQTQTNGLPNLQDLSKDRIASTFSLPPEPKPHRAINGVIHLVQCYEKVIGWPDHSFVAKQQS